MIQITLELLSSTVQSGVLLDRHVMKPADGDSIDDPHSSRALQTLGLETVRSIRTCTPAVPAVSDFQTTGPSFVDESA